MKKLINDLYDYTNMKIFQYDEAFKFSLDSILLAELVRFHKNDKNILDFVVEYGICSSKREAREFVSAGAISFNNKKINDLDYVVSENDTIDNKLIIIKKGKKNYYLGMVS